MMLTAAPNAWPLCRVGLRPAAATSATVNSTTYDYTAPPPAEAAEKGGRAFAAGESSYRGRLRNSATTGGNTTTFTWDINAGLPQILDDGSQYVYGAGLISAGRRGEHVLLPD